MLSSLIVPRHLEPGDTVATVSLSWGGAGDPLFHPRYLAGIRVLEDHFGIKVVEMTNTLKGSDFLYNHPQARVDDLHQAFSDPNIKAVISCVGGDDSVRLIDKINFDLLRNNPKIFLGFSDSTVTHFACLKSGLRSYYGPSILAGFDENTGPHRYMIDAVRDALFSHKAIGELHPSDEGWTDERLAWEVPENRQTKRKMHPAMPWKFIQGSGRVSGRLLGGCTEVIQFILGTSVWPPLEAWDGAILFLENSEDVVTPQAFLHMLRNLGAIGILHRINGIIFGRPYGVALEKFSAYDDILIKATKEFNRPDMVIVTQMDFGHTVPVFVIPYGAMATIDPERKTFSVDEEGCS